MRQDILSSESCRYAKNTQGVSECPTLLDLDQRCVWTTMLFLLKLWLRNQYMNPCLIFLHWNWTCCRLCWFWNGIGHYAVMVMMTWSYDSVMHLDMDYIPAKPMASPNISEACLIFWYKYSILPRLPSCQSGLANMWCWICHNET
jgi:hypothetical protein